MSEFAEIDRMERIAHEQAERIADLESHLIAAEQGNKDYVADASREITVRDDRIAALRAENTRLNKKMPCGVHRRVDAETPEGKCGACLVLRHEEELSNRVERLRTMSTVEMMCENPNVDAHVRGWEARCLKAEARVERLKGLLRDLVEALEKVHAHPTYQKIFRVARFTGTTMKPDDPEYTQELQAAKQALAAQGDHAVRREARASHFPQPHREDEAAQGEER